MERIFVGVLRLVLRVPGARSRKDRRQAVLSVRDRLRHRFSASVHEVDSGDSPTRAVLAITTAGNDQRLIRSILDQAASVAAGSGRCVVTDVDVDVFRWHPQGQKWPDVEIVDDPYDTEEHDG